MGKASIGVSGEGEKRGKQLTFNCEQLTINKKKDGWWVEAVWEMLAYGASFVVI